MKKLFHDFCAGLRAHVWPMIQRVIKICVWPVLAVITVGEHIIKLLCTLGRAVVAVFREVGDCFQELFKGWKERRRKRKTWRKLVRLLSRIIISGTPLLQGTILGGVTGLLMLLLQTISFFTTYGGTRYYFSDIGGWAPIALALVVQGTILAFSFSLETKGQNQAARTVVLRAMVCVSILLSYVGMVNSAIPPYEDFTKKYDTVYDSVAVLQSTLMDDPEVAYSPLAAASVVYEEIQYGRTCWQMASNLLSSESAAEEHIQEMLDLMSQQSYSTTTTESPDGTTTTVVSTVSRDNSEDLTKLAEEMKSQEVRESIRAGVESLGTALSAFGVDMESGGKLGAADILEWEAVMKGYADEENEGRKHFYETYENYNQVVMASAALMETFRGLLENNPDFTLPEAIPAAEFLQKLEAYDTLSGLWIGTSDDILKAVRLGISPEEAAQRTEAGSSEVSGLSGFIGQVLKIQTSTIETYQSVMKNYLNQTQKAMGLFEGLKGFQQSGENWENIQACYETFSDAPDASIIAFSRLLNRSTIQRAIVPALLAIVVDGGTMLIAWGGQRRRYSPLYANTNRDYFEEETDLLEQIFVSTLRAEKIEEPGNISDEEFIRKCESAVIKTVEFVSGYLEKFEPFQATVEFGCGLIAKADDISSEQYTGLTSLLLNMGYLCPLSEQQHCVLASNRLDKRLSEETAYYCLKFRAESYLRQCTTSTSLYAHYTMDYLASGSGGGGKGVSP